MSKSNDPEVQDFLRTVLSHRADFRWIQGEASRFHRQDQILPLKGVPYKNKRAFYSSLTDYPPYANYGYRMSPKHDQFLIDRPMNDAYPYEEDAMKIYNKRSIFADDEDDYDNYSRKKRDLQYRKYDSPAERMLDEKLRLRNLLRKGGNRMNAKDFDQNMLVDIISDGEKGELEMPGNKYEFKTLAKRDCAEDPNEHDIKIGNDTLENPLGEFYYSIPHDILGMSQDLPDEPPSPNKTCIKYKKNVRQVRSINLDGLLNPRRKKQGKTIKIKIFDDGRLVKNIKKDDGTNSIVLTIKNDATTEQQLPTGDLSSRYLLELNRYSNKMNAPRITYDSIKDDDTLQKIDTILRNDEATLKLSAQIPVQLKQKPAQSISDIVRENSLHERSRKETRSDHPNSEEEPESYAYRPQPISNSNGNSPQISTNNAAAKLKENYSNKNHNFKKQAEDTFPTVQNRLEDQTEPTSAAEQRELGKINNKFQESSPMTDMVSTEKMIVIPFKKSADEEVLETDDDTDNKKRQMNRFHVKDSKDMIHTLRNKKQSSNENHVDAHLRDAENVLDKLKVDLEHTIKENLINKDVMPLDKSVALTEDNSDKGHLERSSLNSKLKNDLLDFLETDDETSNITDEEANEILDKLSENKRKKRNFDDLNLMSSQDFNDFLNSLEEKENVADPFEADYDLENNNERKGRSFNSRTLKSIELPRSRRERSLKDLLGMTNDEDYSEDRIDDYMDVKSKRSESHQKIKSKSKAKSKKSKYKKNNKKHKDEKVESVAKEEIDKTKKSSNSKKVKKDVEEVERLEEKLNIFTNNLDLLKKPDGKIEEKRDNENFIDANNARAVRRTSIFKKVDKEPKTNYLTQESDDNSKQDDDNKHIEENSKTNDDSNTKEDDENINSVAENVPRQVDETLGKAEEFDEHDGEDKVDNPVGNELDIIEKTQAILLHITNPPTDCSTSRGEYDDSDDMSSYDGKAIRHRDEGGLKVKHQRVFNLVDNAGDDVVGEIMRIVNNYKEKSLRSNKKNEKKVHEDEDENNLANQTGKDHMDRLHPKIVNMKTCHRRPGTDHNYHQKHTEDTEFVAPKPVKEAFTDLDGSTSNNKQEEEESFNIKRDLRNDENPMQFTPDSFESFKDVIEEKPDFSKNKLTIRLASNAERDKRYLKNLKKYKYKKRVKRDLDQDDDEIIDNLLSPMQPTKKRYRRFQNVYYNPYLYNNFLRYKLQTQNVSEEVTTHASSSNPSPEASGNGTTVMPPNGVNQTVAAGNETCPEDVTSNPLDKQTDKGKMSHEEKKKLKKNKKKMKDECLEEETYDLRHKGDENKSETEREKQLRIKNREKLKNDRMENRQKEKERLKTILNGHMINDILTNFDIKLKENGHLFERFSNSIGRQCIKDQVNVIEKRRDEQSKKDIKHAQLMLHQVIVMLNKIVADQVHRRTCLALPPILDSFLGTLATPSISTKSKQISEGYPLPEIHGKKPNSKNGKPDEKQGDFLFDHEDDGKPGSPNNEITMKKKIVLIKKLLNKYNNMSDSCQIKVEPVRDYLVEHLSMLEKLSKEKKTEVDEICTALPGFEGNCTTTTAGPAAVNHGHKEAGNSTEHAAGSSTVTGNETSSTVELTTTGTATTTTTTAASPHDSNPAARSYYNFEYPDRFRFLNNDKKILSDRYRKLVEAADSYRRKRQIEKRLVRLFGGGGGGGGESGGDADAVETREKKEVPDLRDIAFEAPIVYSLDD
ncbi:PREDICTED: putative leucine-rich repeat-containing protein DDB_G0290503 [Nicrophorus vespilloides]|uniref:Leucine-rich repeat-containing protein DDB_G0290503 n=1 Tax=Nicrophorus vespilloides TaxID=110193 RepID=A0ABM1M9S6_NICVS|nr:PREDICTED: putative leucine-rich repeat-containing protein DDB_G0290503 [Nicrophorus vespilloides]